MLKCDFDRSCYLPSNGTIGNFVLRELDLNFQGQTFRVAILTSKRWTMQSLLLTSNRKSGICHRAAPLRMLYVVTLTNIFKGHEFSNVNFSETVTAHERCYSMSFSGVNVCHRVDHCVCYTKWPWPKFKSLTFKVAILISKHRKMQSLSLPSDSRSDICHRTPHRMLYSAILT